MTWVLALTINTSNKRLKKPSTQNLFPNMRFETPYVEMLFGIFSFGFMI